MVHPIEPLSKLVVAMMYFGDVVFAVSGDLNALAQIAAGVSHADGGSYGPTFGQQLSDYGATGLSGCAGY